LAHDVRRYGEERGHMNGVEYWIWLQEVLGQANNRIGQILDCFGSPRNLLEASGKDKKLCGLFNQPELGRMESPDLSSAAQTEKYCRHLGYSVLVPDDPLYPQRLRQLADFPAVLYCHGSLPQMDDEPVIAVVGTRKASGYGLDLAYKTAVGLARAGFVVVSGCAMGVDSAAHNGTLDAGGRTVGILGCGLNTPYLMQNLPMRERIAKTGALISEYPPDTKAYPQHFPMRNRLISALALGCVVIEAPLRSGSLITALTALEQGRDVFVVPGNVGDINSEGSNELLKCEAKPITAIRDIAEEYTSAYEKALDLTDADVPLHKIRLQKAEPDAPREQERYITAEELAGLGEHAVKLVHILNGNAYNTDELVQLADLELQQVQMALTELEIMGLVEARHGKRYSVTAPIL